MGLFAEKVVLQGLVANTEWVWLTFDVLAVEKELGLLQDTALLRIVVA